MDLHITGIGTEEVERLRGGGGDAHAQTPLVRVAEGAANPCRHCLELIEEGDSKLVLAYQPFHSGQPYAETGPIFLHMRDCVRYDSSELPGWFVFLEPAMIRGYDREDWIRYETGNVVAGRDLRAECEKILADPEVGYVHIRSKFGCFQCRVERG